MVLEKKLKRKGEHVWLIEWWQSILERVYCTVYSYRLQRVLVEVRQLTQKTPNRRVVGANIEHWKSTWGKCIVKEDVSRDFNLQFFLMNTPGSLINRLKFFSNLGFRFHRYIWIRKKLHPQHTKTPRFLTTVELKFSNFAIEIFNKSTQKISLPVYQGTMQVHGTFSKKYWMPNLSWQTTFTNNYCGK